MQAIKPRRSLLYMPGSNARALEKARTLDADVLIFDLEDAVAPSAKQAARETVSHALAQGPYPASEVLLRVNGSDTPWGFDDLRAAATLPIDGVVLPKVDDSDRLHHNLDTLNNAAEREIPVWVMTETARGVLEADRLYGASPQITGVILGTSDLSRELRIPHTPDRAGFIHLLSHCVIAARAHGMDIIDGVHLNFRDLDEFALHCEQGRTLGFDGKSLIHPQQIPACNAAFSPEDKAISEAREIVAAWDRAQQAGQGVCVVNDRLIENLHVEEAQRTLALATALAQRGDAET